MFAPPVYTSTQSRRGRGVEDPPRQGYPQNGMLTLLPNLAKIFSPKLPFDTLHPKGGNAKLTKPQRPKWSPSPRPRWEPANPSSQ